MRCDVSNTLALYSMAEIPYSVYENDKFDPNMFLVFARMAKAGTVGTY